MHTYTTCVDPIHTSIMYIRTYTKYKMHVQVHMCNYNDSPFQLASLHSPGHSSASQQRVTPSVEQSFSLAY